MVANLIPAAQYLRMSTEHQQYSLDNQSAAIQRYANAHGFEIVQTYSDAAKSGVALKRRTGLRQLLQDVVSGNPAYRAILVYDVSRWGRFQDTDESAHYEFVCKSAGVPVHYCAETFANDGSLPSLIMKALKRTMAGEYSRELGVKVLAGQRRLATLGFKQGGMPGYGLRRLLISSDGSPKLVLVHGERKSIATDRVILVPGSAQEAQTIRDIYRMLISEGMPIYAIARELNHRGVPYQNGSRWTHHTVAEVLTNPKYAGCHVYGRTTSRLYTPTIRLPKADWLVSPGAFEPIVDYPTFLEAQRILGDRTINKTDEELLEALKRLLAQEGKLSLSLVKESPDVPSPSTYRLRFGSLRRAYELIGYGRADQFGSIDLRRRTQVLREELVARIAALFPNEVTVIRRGGRWRSRLRLRNGLTVCVLIARSIRAWKEAVRWQIDPVRHERKFITLLARLDEANQRFLDYDVLPSIDRSTRFQIRHDDPWLDRGIRLDDFSEFRTVVAQVARLRRANRSKKLVLVSLAVGGRACVGSVTRQK
jgi:DNA invertase Pin-like site-specific DNA recombinase